MTDLVRDITRRPLRWFGRLIVWFVSLTLRGLKPDPRWVEQVRSAIARGGPVFVLRHLSLVDFVVLDHLLRSAGLPPIAFVYGLETWFYRPFRWIYRAWMRPPDGMSDEKHVVRLIRRGVPVCLFLRCRPRTFKLRALRLGPRPLALCAALARRGTRVTAIPELVVWGRRPSTAERGIMARVLGPHESPGMIRAVFQAIKGRRQLIVRQLEPVDVAEWAATRPRKPATALGRTLDAQLARRLESERRAAVGPEVKSHARAASELFSSARFQRDLAAVAASRGVPIEHVRVEAARILGQTAARFRIEAIEFLQIIFARIWNRIYDGIEVGPEGLERVVQAAREGSLILLPNHKSHIDYVILSQIFYDAKIAVPHIAAGRNLSFWPLGAIFRRAGAFFIRRKFEGDELYVTVLRAYCRKLLLDGSHVEVFFEGTRSRTGKMQPPKIGLLGMLAEAGLTIRGRPIRVVPVAITYERVIEDHAHVQETMGHEEKAPEDIGGLLAARRFLRSRYGRLHVRFGEPIDLHAFAREQEITAASARDRMVWRPRMLRLAYRCAHAINRETLATPTALVAAALLGSDRGGMRVAEIEAEVIRLRDLLRATGAPLASSLEPSDDPEPLREAVGRALELFAGDGTVLLTGPKGAELVVADDRTRPRLDYYRNTVLHFLVEPALVALGLLQAADREGLPARVSRLARLWKYEFIYADEEDALPGTDRGLAFLESIGAVRAGAGPEIAIVDRAAVRRMGRILLAFLESYRVALLVLERASGARREAEIVSRCVSECDRLFLRGKVSVYEARNRVSFANSLRALRYLGFVEFPRPGEVRVLPEAQASEKLMEKRLMLERTLAALAGREA